MKTLNLEARKDKIVTFTSNDGRELFDLLYKLEDHFEVRSDDKHGIITSIIQNLNTLGIKY